jgi:DNA-directed RNA polymerase specialized sigma subunit
MENKIENDKGTDKSDGKSKQKKSLREISESVNKEMKKEFPSEDGTEVDFEILGSEPLYDNNEGSDGEHERIGTIYTVLCDRHEIGKENTSTSSSLRTSSKTIVKVPVYDDFNSLDIPETTVSPIAYDVYFRLVYEWAKLSDTARYNLVEKSVHYARQQLSRYVDTSKFTEWDGKKFTLYGVESGEYVSSIWIDYLRNWSDFEDGSLIGNSFLNSKSFASRIDKYLERVKTKYDRERSDFITKTITPAINNLETLSDQYSVAQYDQLVTEILEKIEKNWQKKDSEFEQKFYADDKLHSLVITQMAKNLMSRAQYESLHHPISSTSEEDGSDILDEIPDVNAEDELNKFITDNLLKTVVDTVMAQLQGVDREIFTLYFFYGIKPKNIVKYVKLSESTVYRRLNKIKQLLEATGKSI